MVIGATAWPSGEHYIWLGPERKPLIDSRIPDNSLPARKLGGLTLALLAQQATQHVLHDAAVAVVVGLAGGVDPDDRVE